MGELKPIGELIGSFWQGNTLREEAEKFKGRNDVRFNEAGMPVCRKCGAPKMFYLKEARRWLPCPCRCVREDDEDFYERCREYTAVSGIVGRNRRMTFDSFDPSPKNESVFKSCVRYASQWPFVKSRGLGLYLYGEKDTGKTHLAAAIGNELLANGVRVVFTTVEDMLDEIRKTYSRQLSEADVVNRYVSAELVIFDDLGTENYRGSAGAISFAQGKFFQILDGRYTREKPTVFTSNYRLEQLTSERGMLAKTVSRIGAMSTRKFEVRGDPHRLQRIPDEDCPF